LMSSEGVPCHRRDNRNERSELTRTLRRRVRNLEHRLAQLLQLLVSQIARDGDVCQCRRLLFRALEHLLNAECAREPSRRSKCTTTTTKDTTPLETHPHVAQLRAQGGYLALEPLDLSTRAAHVCPQLPGISSDGQGNLFVLSGHQNVGLLAMKSSVLRKNLTRLNRGFQLMIACQKGSKRIIQYFVGKTDG
ncbi:hypothetical protein LCGC14_2393020, partial [marine sediment metagenome]